MLSQSGIQFLFALRQEDSFSPRAQCFLSGKSRPCLRWTHSQKLRGNNSACMRVSQYSQAAELNVCELHITERLSEREHVIRTFKITKNWIPKKRIRHYTKNSLEGWWVGGPRELLPLLFSSLCSLYPLSFPSPTLFFSSPAFPLTIINMGEEPKILF